MSEWDEDARLPLSMAVVHMVVKGLIALAVLRCQCTSSETAGKVRAFELRDVIRVVRQQSVSELQEVGRENWAPKTASVKMSLSFNVALI